MTTTPKTPDEPKTLVASMSLSELGEHLKALVSTQNPYSTQFEKAILNFLLVLVAEKQRQAKQIAKKETIK